MQIVFQEQTALGPQVTYSRPSKTSVTIFTADDKLHKINSPAILRPDNLEKPVVCLPLSINFPVTLTLQDFVHILSVIQECSSNDTNITSLTKEEVVERKRKTLESPSKATATARPEDENSNERPVCQIVLFTHH